MPIIDPNDIVGEIAPGTIISEDQFETSEPTPAPGMSYSDRQTYLQNNPLIKPGMNFINNMSYGAQKALLDLGHILAPETFSKEDVQKQKNEMPPVEGISGVAGNVAGHILAPGPGGPAGSMGVAGSLPNLVNHPTIGPKLLQLGEKASELATKVGRPIGATINWIGKKLASVEAMGLNEKVKDLIAENPEVVFQPKDLWQATQKEVWHTLKTSKEEIGTKVGAIEQQALARGINTSVDIQDTLNTLDTLKGQLPASVKGKFGGILDSFANTLKTGGEKTSAPVSKSAQRVFMGPTEGWISKAFEDKALKELNVQQMKNVLNSVDSDPNYLQAVTNAQTGKIQAVTPAQRLLLGARASIKEKYDSAIEALDDQVLQSGLTKAKGEYRNYMEQNRFLGNLTEKNLPKKFKALLRYDNESSFDAMRGLIPDYLFKKMTGNIVNQSSERGATSFTPYGALRKVGEFVEGATAQTGGVISGKQPTYQIGQVPTTLLAAKQAVPEAIGAGISNVAQGLNNPIFLTSQMPKLIPWEAPQQ